jgi:hypothetical protein
MTEHTTIQITAEQAEQLRELRNYDDESYKSVIGRLLEGDNSAIDGDELLSEVRKTQELVERVPEDTADELGSKYL